MANIIPIKFGTDGWRAIIADTYTYANVRRCTAGLARHLISRGQAQQGVVIGYDTRFGSKDFAEVAASTMAALGVPVYLNLKPAPTPTVSYAIIDKQAAGCIIITASHNPAKYNGLKFRPDYAGPPGDYDGDRDPGSGRCRDAANVAGGSSPTRVGSRPRPLAGL